MLRVGEEELSRETAPAKERGERYILRSRAAEVNQEEKPIKQGARFPRHVWDRKSRFESEESSLVAAHASNQKSDEGVQNMG